MPSIIKRNFSEHQKEVCKTFPDFIFHENKNIYDFCKQNFYADKRVNPISTLVALFNSKNPRIEAALSQADFSTLYQVRKGDKEAFINLQKVYLKPKILESLIDFSNTDDVSLLSNYIEKLVTDGSTINAFNTFSYPWEKEVWEQHIIPQIKQHTLSISTQYSEDYICFAHNVYNNKNRNEIFMGQTIVSSEILNFKKMFEKEDRNYGEDLKIVKSFIKICGFIQETFIQKQNVDILSIKDLIDIHREKNLDKINTRVSEPSLHPKIDMLNSIYESIILSTENGEDLKIKCL